MIVLFWYLVRLLLTAFRKPKPSGGSHAITFGTSTRAGDSLTTLTMKSSNHSDTESKDYRGGSSSTVGQEDLIPIFLRRLNDLNIRVGTRTRFLIELDDATGVQVRWYHNNTEANSERYQYIHEGGFYCLDIVPVTLFDEGLWVCTAQNYAGKSSTAAHLSLTVPKAFKKPIFVEQLKAVLTQRGIVSLECKVIGVPTPKLRWYKDDKEIKAGDIFALTANSEEDCLGIYTCEATNVMGTALSTSKIQVTHTPLDGNRDADSLIPYGPPPKFVKFLKDASGKVGNVLFLECQVEVPPWPRSIGWYNNNGIVNEGPLYHLMADGLGMYGIEIKSLRADHSTTWKCVATSSTGAKAVTSCVVSVSYPKNYRVPRFLESLRAIMTDEGLVSFECKVIGYPTPQLSWFKDGKQLQPGDVYELTGSKSLGSYCCVARNCMGETSSIAELTIEDIQNQLNESEKLQLTSNTQPPRFLLGLKSIEANINESFVFTIKVTTESTPSISWYKEDEQLTESNRYQFSSEDNGTYMLSILPLEIDDQAEWKCVAINRYGQTVTSSFLKLNIPKTFKSPKFLEELRIAFSNEGSVNLECKVIGVPQPQLKWFKDGQELNPGDMHKIISGQSGTCCLGTYTCQAHNCMGTVSSSATLLTMEDKSTVKSCASEEYLSVGNPLVRNESLSTIPEERTSQMEKSYTIEEPADISFSFDGKEVTVSLYETPDLTHDEALQIIEMYADELSEHISEDNVVDLPSLRIVKESSISGPVMMEALVIDVPIDFCRQQIVSDTEFDGVSLTEDITLGNNDKSDSICENSLEYFSDHLSSGNSKREVFYSASETTPKNSSTVLKQQSENDGHQSFQTPKLFMSDSDDQILTQLKLDERISPNNSRHVIGPLARSESNNTEEEVSETLAEIENEPPLSHNYCASEIVTQSDEDGLYSTVLNKIRDKGMESVVLSSEEDDVLKIISRPNVDEFLKYMKIILEGSIVKMNTHEHFNFTSTTTELERSIQALHSLAWKFIEETERQDVTELDKNTADNVSNLMTAINASLLALEQIDDPFGVSDNVLNEIQSLVCFDLETLNNSNLSASVILDRLSDQIKNFTIVVNKQVTRVTEQRIIAVLRNTIGTSLVYIKTLQQNCSKIKCVDINSLAPLFSMVQPLETILNDIAIMEEASIDDNKPHLRLKQILIPPISSIAFSLDSLSTALKSDSSNDDQDLKGIYDRISDSNNQFMILASQGMDSNKIAECFISFTKPINDLCCHLRRLGRSTENIVSSDYGSDDKLLLDFETIFDELMMDIDTLINNVNFVQDSENNMNPLGSLLEPLQDMKIGLFQVNQVLLSNQTGSTLSYEVMSCFEHLSQQLVQLNNCIANQSIVEETDKEIPFESSIKMMQNILFDDAIDDLGVNGILFGSVMKPLLQLQNLIVSKMASVESDLSFSEHTDVTGGACDTHSLSLSLSNNAQTIFNKTTDENSKKVITESSIIDSSDNDCEKQNKLHIENSGINKDSISFENNVHNDLVIKRGFECDIGDTFKDEEPNIITSEDDRDNSGFEALFDETDLETISDFVEDGCMDNIINSKVDQKLSDLSVNDSETVHKDIDNIIPKHVLESLEKNNQDLVLNSSVDLFDELQETLKHISEVTEDKLTEIYDLDTNTLNIKDLQKNNSKYSDIHNDNSNTLLDDLLDVTKINNSTIIINSDKLTKQNMIELSEVNNEEMNQCNEIVLKIDQNETFKNKDLYISDQDAYKKEQVFEIGQDVNFIENVECLDSDKSISNNTIITVNEISDSNEIKMKEVDNTDNSKTTVNLLESTSGNVSPIVYVDVPDESASSFKNENLDSLLLNKSNFNESIKNIKIVSSEDIIDPNKLNESKKLNILSNDNNTANKDTLLIKEIVEPSIAENVTYNSVPQDYSAINEIDSIYNAGANMNIQVSQTSIEEEFNKEKDNKLIPIDKSINAIELNKVFVTLVEEKHDTTLETNLLIGNQNTLIGEEISNDIKQNDDIDLINKINCNVEEREPTTEPDSSIGYISLMTDLEDDIIKDIAEKQNSGDKNLSLIKSENNDSGTFEIDQNINFDKILHQDLQPNINTTSVTDNKQIVNNSTISENKANLITELNVDQSEEYIQNLPNQFIHEIQNQKNESEVINEKTLENVQQKCFTIQQNNIFLQLSNNEEKSVDDLNEQRETLSEIKENNEVEFIDSKKVLPEIIYLGDLIDIKNVEECVIDNSNRIDDLSITQSNVDNGVHMPVTEVAEVAKLNVLDEQLVIMSLNAEESEKSRKVCECSIENNKFIDNIDIQFKNGVTNDFENTVHLTLNEKEKCSEEKYSDNDITEISMNDNENSINTLNKSLDNFKQSNIINIIDNNNTNLLESTLINNEIITLEKFQPTDQYKFEENPVEIQFKENIESRNEHFTVLDDKDNITNNLEHLESKNEVFYFPDDLIENDEEKSCCEIQKIQNDGSIMINESPNIEQTTALVHNEMISVCNTQPLDTVVIEFGNIKEQNEIELNIPETTNIENTIDTTVETINSLNNEAEIVSNDKNNLIYDVNKDKYITKDYFETHTSNLIDEKSNSVCNEDDLKKNSDILKAMNNFHTENNEEKILTKSQLSDESQIVVSLTENDCATSIVDLETTKINNKKKVESYKTPVFENYITKQESPLLVNENTENCKEIASLSNVCIEILNENNVNQQNKFNECHKNVILEKSDTLMTVSHEQSGITNTIINVEKSIRNEDDLEINETSEKNHNKNDTDKKEIPIVIDLCKSMENNESLVFNKNQSFSLCDIDIENMNENLTTDLEINQEITENNFVKPLAIKYILEGIGNLKNDETHMEDKNILKNLETSTNELETTIDNTQRVDSNESKKRKENSTIEKLPNLADELNTLLETPKNECLLINKEIDSKLIETSNFDFSVDESLQIDTDIKAQHNNTSTTEKQNMSVYSTEKVNVMTEDHPDNSHNDKSNSSLIEIQGNEVSNTINENEENEHSIMKLESINIDEDKLTNVVEINDQIDIMTAVENNSNLLNDSIFEYGITDLSNEESLNSLSVMPKLHYTEKIAANQTECVMLEDTSILKQNEPNAMENVDQYAQVEHELNIAAIGNIIIDYDSVKEHSGTADNEKKCIENATIAVILDDHSFKTVSNNVGVLEAPITDTIIRNEHTVTNEQLENSIKAITLLCENKNSNILTVDDLTENSDNVVTENVQSEIGSMNEPTEIFNEDIDKQGNLVLKQDRNEEVVNKLQQSLKKSNQICESLVLSKDENDTTEEVQSDVLIENIKITKNEKTNVTNDKTDIKQKLNLRSKESPSLYTSTNNISVKENKIDTTKTINETLDEKNKMLSDEKKNTEKVITDFKSEQILEKIVKSDDENKNNKKNEIDNEEKLNDNEVELDNTKRGSKKKKTSLRSEDKKSPSPDKTKITTSVSEKGIDKSKKTDISIEEKNKNVSDENNDIQKAEIKLSKVEPEIASDNDRSTEEIIEKDVSTDDKNKNNTKNETDNNEEKLNDNEVELDNTKRGSKKKKTSLRSEDKKSPSPDKTKITTCVSEKGIDKSKKTDTSIEEKNKNVSDENNDIQKAEIKLSKSEPEIASDNDRNTKEVIEKDVSTDDKNKNKKNNETDNNKEKLNDNEVELDNTKRGSKKKKTSLRSEDKKSPSPDKTKITSCVSKKGIDKSKKIDISIEEKNENVSDENNDIQKAEIKLSKSEPEIASDNDRNTKEVIEKDVSTDDKNKNKKNNETDNNKEKLNDNEVELDNTKRGSKKKKTSLRSEDKKSPSPDKTKITSCVSEKGIDKSKKIDISIEEKNENVSDENNDIQKAEIKLSKLEPEIASDNERSTEEVIEKDVSTDDKNKNKTKNETDNNEEKLNDNEVELDNTKRGSKKKKTSLRSEDKKSPSPDKTKITTSVSEKGIDKSKKTDISIEEKNKNVSDENNDIQKAEIKLSKVEPEIASDNDRSTEEIIEKDVSTDDKNKNNTKNETDNNEEKLNDNEVELDNTKRGSKKKKTSLRSEDKKSPSPDKTKITTCVSEKGIDKSKKTDTSIEEKNKNVSDENNDIQKAEIKLSKSEPEIASDNDRNTKEVIEKDVSTDDKNKNKKNNETDNNKEKLNDNEVELDNTKRGSKKKKTSLRSEDKKSPSPDKTKITSCVSKKGIDKSKKIDISIEEKNENVSDENNDIQKAEIKLSKSEPEIASDNDRNTKEVIEKDVSTDDKNKNKKNNETDNNKEKLNDNEVELDNTKRGSKKKKTSLRSEDKKSPSPDKTKITSCVSEKGIDKSKKIDISIEEKNENVSDENNDIQKAEIKLSKLEPEIASDNERSTEEVIEKDVSTDDKNKNKTKNETDNNEEKLNDNEVELDNTKRGSKKKKTSLRSEDKKSPSPDKTKITTSVSEKGIDKSKKTDISIEEKNKNVSDENNDIQKAEIKLSKVAPEIASDNDRSTEEVIEKDVSTDDKNKNKTKNETDNNEEKLNDNEVELDNTKRGSKKKKTSLRSEDKKSPSPDKTKITTCVSEKGIDKSKKTDISIEEKNKNVSDENNDIQKAEIKLSKLEPEIASDNDRSTEEVIEKDVSIDDKNKNKKNIETDNNDEKLNENEIELEKTKRGSQKKKSSLQSEDKKSPSPEGTKNSLSINDKTAEATKISNYSLEEKNKKLSEHYNDTENLELGEFEPKITSENNKNKVEMIEKDISDNNKNQKNNEIDADDKKLLEYGKDKKNKINPESEIKKLSSPGTSNYNINVIENEIDAKIMDGTNLTMEDNNIQILEDNKHTEQVGTTFKSKTAVGNNTNTTKKIEKDVSKNTPIKHQNNDDIGKDDEINLTENCVEIDSTKQESKRNKRSPQLNDKKSTSPDKTKNITEHIKIQSRDGNDSIIELEQLEDKSVESTFLEESIQTPEHKEVTPLAFQELSTNNYKSTDCCQSEIFRKDTTWKGMNRKQTDETRSFVDVSIDEEGHRVAKNCFTTNKRELRSSGLTELNDISVSEVPSLSKRPVNRHLLDVTDAHKLRPNTLAYRSVTPDPLSTYRSLTPDHLTSCRSLTPDDPPYRTCLTTRSKYATSTRYAGSSDRELYGGSSSSRSSRSSSRSMSPYPSESRISARNLWPTGVEAYRCLSETSIPLSSRLLKEEKISGWPYTSYGVTSRRRRGSDSFLHDSAVRDEDYYSSWRFSNSRSSTYGATEDLCQTKEAFKDLYFCVRMIDKTVSSGARVKFWCSVIGYPEPRIQWYRDGQKLNSFTYNSSARYQTKYDGGLAQLIIDNAQSGDSGEYTCVAANSRDRISTTGFLTVYTSPSVFRKPLLQPSLSVDNIEYSRGVYSRTSHDFRLPANAKFDFGSRKFGSDLISRRPEYPKFVSSIIADDVATCGGTIALQVRLQGSPVPNVTWMRESRPLPRLSGKYVYLDEGGLYTLLIMDSTARDSGTYVCRACNLYGMADAEKAVRVVSPQDYTDRRGVKPAIIVSRPNDRLNVAIGEDITVTLRVAGEPKPKVIWMRGSRDVTFFDRSSKETVNDYVMLSIKKAQPSDAGTYFIIAKNVYGSDRAFVTVGVRKRARSLTPPQIRNSIGQWLRPIDGRGGRGGCANNEVPGPVRSEPAVTDRTKNRISLQWDRPEKPETVLVYRVEARSADEECWRQVGMTPTNTIDVYNLKPGYRYQFRVAARNRFGWSQPVAAKGYVDVFEPKCLPEFCQPLPGQTRVLLRHSATLQCHVRGVPEPWVSWFKDGEPLLSSERHAVRRTNTGKCTLTIADVSDGDEGRYSCEAVNDQGRVCTMTVVQVIANRRIVEAERRLQGCLMKNNNFKESAPVFTKHLIDRRVEINSTVRLSCQVNGLPVPLVLWYKDGQPIDFSGGTEGDRKSIFRDDSDDFYTLELTGVKYNDSGAYAAVASNAIGKASTQCVLEVFNKNRTDPAVPMFVFGLPTTSEAVDSIILSAQIDAYRPVKVQWFRDGIQLRNGRRVDIITDHDGKLELRIACVTTRDSGTYMLRVSNDTGTVESRCEVNVVERAHNDTGMEQISLINHLYSKKPKFVVKPKFQEVEEGQEVIIDSEIVGDPLPKITWLRDGLKPEYYRDNSEFLCISNGNRYQLKIPHAKLTHTGTYTLLAANPHGQIKALISLQVYSTGHCKKKMENGTNHATVERLPRISRGLVDIECRENDSITFECKLNITQETDIRWQKDGKLVRLGNQVKSQLIDGDTARLEISTVSPLHEGLYTCTAFNELGEDSTSARLIFLSDSQTTAKAPQSNGQQNTMLGSPILAGESNDRCTKRLKRSSAPKFYAVLHDRIADVGETVRFQCSVSGHPPPWSSWEKDGQPIGVNSRMRIREDDDYRSLEICDVTSDDAGLYRITVENKFGKIQATARLEVLTHNQTTNDVQITSSSNGRRQSGSAACAGENFTLSCDIRGNSMSDVTWYKNDVEVKPDDRVTSSLDDLAARLSISNLESADTGVYTCVARCDSGVTRCSTELCVFDTKPGTDSYLQPPIFVEGLVPKRTADEGEPVQLTVRLQGAVPMNASWFKNDVLLPDCADFEYVVAEDRGEFGLSIIDPFVKDSGVYSCKVANSFGQAVSSGQLVINEMSCGNELNNNLHDVGKKITCDSPVNTKVPLPASILSGPCDTTLLRGAKVVLKTSYQGDPEPCVQWLRAGKVLVSDAHVCITNERGVSSLTIDSITADDCGKYVVRVDNGHGNDFHFASVAVEGPPDPPAGRPVVSVLETSADVTWSSPAYDGGCMVTGYGVEVRPFNQSDWKLVADKCHSLSHIVRGLAPGESYVFRVRAENMHGSSEASLESTPVYILQTDYGNTLWPKTVNIENGDLFDKQYEMLDELGKGRYGVVYKVKERETNKYYAAKFVRCIKSTDKEKAQEEVDIMNCLRHPKLLQLEAAFDKPREVVLVTEYISGGELFERVVADDFTLTEKDCILFTRQICEGVDYMHKQNVVHLDLKPENIMCQSRTSHYIKLIDFGLAQKIIPGQPMRVLFGTPEFIPPEIIGYEPIGFESDMWSVGVICYVLLSGLSPFMGDNDSETFTNITKAEFDFDDEAFDAVSQDAKDFISALLIKRKELRLTAKECLKHKWLAQQDMDMSCVILSTDKLKKFIIRRKWQKTGNAIRALGRMATLSAASRRGGGGGGGEPTDGNGTRCILQKLKMASLREEDSNAESPTEVQEITITETTKSGSGHKACDDRSDSGFSECPSVASPTAMLVRPPECPSAISEETPLASNRNCSPPPPTRRSTPPIIDRSSSPATIRSSSPTTIRPFTPTTTIRPSSPAIIRSSSPATKRSSSPATVRPSSPATMRRSSPATIRPSSPATMRRSSPATIRPSSPATIHRSSPATIRPSSPATRRAFSPVTTRCPPSPKIGRSSSPTTHGSSSPATRGPSSLTTHPRSPLPRNRHDSTHPVHDVPLPTGTGVSNLCKTNRMIFDGERHDGSKSSAGMSSSGGVQRKEPIRIQTADNFKKAVAFWKQ